MILTVPGQGYRYTAEIETSAGAPAPQRHGRWFQRRVFAPVLVLMVATVTFAATARWSAKESFPTPGALSIAVLPIRSGGFNNLADDATMQLTNGVIDGLASSYPGVALRSSSSVAGFAEPDTDTASEAGRQLDVSFVLEGFAGEAEGERFVELPLIDVDRDAVVWSGRVFDSSAGMVGRPTLESRIYKKVGAGLRSVN